MENIEFARRLYDNVLDWYNSADSKAQVALAINGGFIAFISSTAFMNPHDLNEILSSFGVITWIIFVAMALCLLGSIYASIDCLRSRTYSEIEIKKIIKNAQEKYCSKGKNENKDIYPSSITLFFQFIERLELNKFKSTLENVDPTYEIEALASQIHILAGNVRKKHQDVNISFVLVAATLLLFFAMASSYVFSVL